MTTEIQFFDDDDLDEIELTSKEMLTGREVGVRFLSGITGGSTDPYTEENSGGSEELVWASGVIEQAGVTSVLVERGIMNPGDTAFGITWDKIRGLEHSKVIEIDGNRHPVTQRLEDRWGSRLTTIWFILTDPDGR